MRSALTSRRSRCTDPRRSRNWPTLSSIRSSFHSAQTLGRGPDHQLVGEHEGQVADEDGHALAEAPRTRRPSHRRDAGRCRRRASSARPARAGRVVHHVVVEEGEGVHQLERRAGVDDPGIARVATGADEPPVAERRAEALAARADHPPDLVERPGEVGVERRPARALLVEQLVEPQSRCRGRWRPGSAEPSAAPRQPTAGRAEAPVSVAVRRSAVSPARRDRRGRR